MIMDFHIGGHPSDPTGLRLREIEAYYKACRQQSDSHFLLIPAEEADVYLGGHWSLTFPRTVYWMMKRSGNEAFATPDPKYGTVYRVGSAEDMWKLVEAEHGYAYQTHPRTKGSTGYPDKILDTSYFRDPRYLRHRVEGPFPPTSPTSASASARSRPSTTSITSASAR